MAAATQTPAANVTRSRGVILPDLALAAMPAVGDTHPRINAVSESLTRSAVSLVHLVRGASRSWPLGHRPPSHPAHTYRRRSSCARTYFRPRSGRCLTPYSPIPPYRWGTSPWLAPQSKTDLLLTAPALLPSCGAA